MSNLNLDNFFFTEETVLIPKIKKNMSYSGLKTCQDLENWLWDTKNICNWPNAIRITKEQAKHLIVNPCDDTSIISKKDNELKLETRAGDWSASHCISIEIIID